MEPVATTRAPAMRPEVSAEVLHRYFRPEGRKAGEPYRLLPMYRQSTNVLRQRITMLANFVEVHLAKEGHDGTIGINLLTKVQMPNLASLYGAMLAGVDYVLMGAGIPKRSPASSTRSPSTSPPR
jgi:NAD(P)H-dependent flavin oxidoreductase YrpB (nitropropane dioxygenase family)